MSQFLKNFLINREIRFVEMYDQLLNTELNEANTIQAENINGPILLLSAHEDVMWPSERMGDLIIDRLKSKGFPHSYQHEVFKYASHVLTPNSSPVLSGVHSQPR